MYLTQNIFPKNKPSRTLSLNSHYLVLFKNAREALQVAKCTLGECHYGGSIQKCYYHPIRVSTNRFKAGDE